MEKIEANYPSLRSTLPRAYLHHRNTVVEVSAKVRVNVMERPKQVAVAEDPATTEDSIRAATMVVAEKVAIRLSNMAASQRAQTAAQHLLPMPATAHRRRNHGVLFLNVPASAI